MLVTSGFYCDKNTRQSCLGVKTHKKTFDLADVKPQFTLITFTNDPTLDERHTYIILIATYLIDRLMWPRGVVQIRYFPHPESIIIF